MAMWQREKKRPLNGWSNHIVGTCAYVAGVTNHWVDEIKESEFYAEYKF